MLKAPKGGLVSTVNGQRYEGGEFVPQHGLFCGKKGERRLKAWEKFVAANRTIDLGGSKMFEVKEYEGNGCWMVRGLVICENGNQAVNAATEAWPANKKLYADQI